MSVRSNASVPALNHGPGGRGKDPGARWLCSDAVYAL